MFIAMQVMCLSVRLCLGNAFRCSTKYCSMGYGDDVVISLGSKVDTKEKYFVLRF